MTVPTPAWIAEGCDEIRRALIAGETRLARELFTFVAARCSYSEAARARYVRNQRAKRRRGCVIRDCTRGRHGAKPWCLAHAPKFEGAA